MFFFSISTSRIASPWDILSQRVKEKERGGGGQRRGCGDKIIADERKQAGEINLPISVACC